MKRKYKVAVALVLIFLGSLAVYRYIYLPSNSCVQVLVNATNRITGEEKNFGNPCSVPFWYEDVRDYNPNNDLDKQEDYDALNKKCDSSCCEQSIEIMRTNQYPLYTGECPTGFERNQLLCIQSMAWCEPVASSS